MRIFFVVAQKCISVHKKALTKCVCRKSGKQWNPVGRWAQQTIEILYIRERLTPCTKNYALQNIAKNACTHSMRCENALQFIFLFSSSVVVMQILKCSRLCSGKNKNRSDEKSIKAAHSGMYSSRKWKMRKLICNFLKVYRGAPIKWKF